MKKNITNGLMSVKEIANYYEIPLSKLYKYINDRQFNFPKPVFVLSESYCKVYNGFQVECWYYNTYLKIKNIEKANKNNNQIIVDELLKGLML